MEHTVPYTPQPNGVAKRKNIPLKEMATCLLQAKNRPLSLWAKAITMIHKYRTECLINQWLGPLHLKDYMCIIPMSLF